MFVKAACRNKKKAASPKVALCGLLAVLCIVNCSFQSKKRSKKNLPSSAQPPERTHSSETSLNEKGSEVTKAGVLWLVPSSESLLMGATDDLSCPGWELNRDPSAHFLCATKQLAHGYGLSDRLQT